MLDKFKIVVYLNQIYVDSYDEVVLFDEKEIILKYQKRYIIIKGRNLTINKLLNDELLINGTLEKIELSNV